MGHVDGLDTADLGPREADESDDDRTGVAVRATPKATTEPLEALRYDEVERSRVFATIAFGLTIGGIVIAIATTGDRVAQAIVVGGSFISGIGCAWVLVLTRDPRKFHPRQLLGPCLMIICGSMSGVYYWGSASPITGLNVYGIYFFGLSTDALGTTVVYIALATAHGVLGAGIMTGVLADRGLIKMTSLDTVNQLAIVIIIEFLYTIAFVTARISQRVTLRSVSHLQQAVRAVAQRDALLAEARAELDRALKIGGPGRYTDTTVGAYKLGVLIGRGGMGEVYEARHVQTDIEAAVKLLYPTTLADPVLVKRFVREAETIARLDSPNIVRVLEVGTTAGEVPFLVMERLRGTDLAHQLRRRRRLALATATAIATEIANGLEAARAQDIVHRDLKPSNIFRAEGDRGRWKILDFGVSKVGGEATLTNHQLVGTPAFMAPEQARGAAVDHRADVYALAALLYRAVAGRPVVQTKDVATTLFDVVYRVPPRPSAIAPVPVDVDRVLALGLAKQPDDRIATAIELAQLFAAAVDDRLDAALRLRADAQIARAPWDTHLPAR